MKKKSLVLVAGLLALVALASCSKESGPDMPIVGENNGISFSSNITNRNPGSRASGGTWAKSDPIGVYMFKETGTTLLEENIKYLAEEGGASVSFKPEGNSIFFPDDNTEVTFMAYYPYKAGVTNIYSVDVSSQTNQSAIDLLYSFDEVTTYNKYSQNVDKTIPLQFTHMLSQIKINLTKGAGLNNLDGVTVSLKGMKTKADFDLFNGLLNELKEEAVIIPLLSTNNSYEAIVLPDNIQNNAEIVITLERKEGEGEEEKTYTDRFFWTFNNDLKASNSYTYNVTVNRTGLVVKGSINEWTSNEREEVSAE
jgi:hypothetical protein